MKLTDSLNTSLIEEIKNMNDKFSRSLTEIVAGEDQLSDGMLELIKIRQNHCILFNRKLNETLLAANKELINSELYGDCARLFYEVDTLTKMEAEISFIREETIKNKNFSNVGLDLITAQHIVVMSELIDTKVQLVNALTKAYHGTPYVELPLFNTDELLEASAASNEEDETPAIAPVIPTEPAQLSIDQQIERLDDDIKDELGLFDDDE